MPPALLFDFDQIDLDAPPAYDKAAVEAANPQRYEMQQLDAVVWCDKEKAHLLGYKDVTDQEFWIRGHIPGRPLMPAVVMIEAAAQLLSFYVKCILEVDSFIGFGAIESAKFRTTVAPGQRLYLLGHIYEMKTRRYNCKVQGLVDGTMVFEAVVSGVRL